MFPMLIRSHFTYAEWPRSAATALRLAELHLEAGLRVGQAPATLLSPRPASPAGHSKPIPHHAPAAGHLHGCAANLGLVRLATLVAPGGPGAQPEALDLQQALRQHWAAGRLAERCWQHSAAAGHFEAIVRLCSENADAPPTAGSSAPVSMETGVPTGDAGVQQAGEAVERASAQADVQTEAAACEQDAVAAPARRDAAGAPQVGGAGAEPASALANWLAEAAARVPDGILGEGRPHAQAMEVRVRAAGGGVESVVSASEAAARLEALQLHALLEARLADCVECGGCGSMGQRCWQCDSGLAELVQTVQHVPPGVSKTSRVRITEQGQASTAMGAPHAKGRGADCFAAPAAGRAVRPAGRARSGGRPGGAPGAGAAGRGAAAGARALHRPPRVLAGARIAAGAALDAHAASGNRTDWSGSF